MGLDQQHFNSFYFHPSGHMTVLKQINYFVKRRQVDKFPCSSGTIRLQLIMFIEIIQMIHIRGQIVIVNNMIAICDINPKCV